MKESVRSRLSTVSFLRGVWTEIKRITRIAGGYPVPVAVLEQTLIDMGVWRGDLLHVQSSVSHLHQGWPDRVAEDAGGQMAYATRIVKMLKDLVGPTGTLMMNTDSLTHAEVRSAWAGVLPPDRALFDYARSPSRRGLISELFRRQAGVVRSVHPWYNMTALGPAADELMRDNERSTPFALDRHSAIWKLTMMGGKIALLGQGFSGNVPMHLIEYVHADEYPRAVFVNRPVKVTYMDYGRRMQSLDVLLHAQDWYLTGLAGAKFCEYLDGRHHLYKRRRFKNAEIVCFDARSQYEASYQEMKDGVCWYDPQFDG